MAHNRFIIQGHIFVILENKTGVQAVMQKSDRFFYFTRGTDFLTTEQSSTVCPMNFYYSC